MAACEFKIPFSVPLAGMVEKARQVVESQGGQFTGDEIAGQFHVSIMGNTVRGSYKAEGSELLVQIDEKPIFAPCSLIESYLKQQLVG
jgi:hypothetical protein